MLVVNITFSHFRRVKHEDQHVHEDDEENDAEDTAKNFELFVKDGGWIVKKLKRAGKVSRETILGCMFEGSFGSDQPGSRSVQWSSSKTAKVYELGEDEVLRLCKLGDMFPNGTLKKQKGFWVPHEDS